jgi:phenylpropionate dioxygenase-like ring-hydroxylating dioxygenase large terminal subunit
MRAEQNVRLTRVGPGTACGALLRQYWQPVALVDEFNPELVPEMAARPVKAVRCMGQDMVLFKQPRGGWALLDRGCPHRGADLSYGRLEADGLRCPFHGWKFAPDGRCLETPAEPEGSRLCQSVRQRSYPVVEKSGLLFAWLGPESQTPPAFAALDCFAAPGSHTFVFKGLLQCNWLQALEVGIDPAHASYLHRFFEDEALSASYGKQFRGASADSAGLGGEWPMTRVLREFDRPEIVVEPTAFGLQLTALRQLNDTHTHVRVTNQVFPQAFVIPLSEDITITQWHVPVDDFSCYWVAIFTSFGAPLNKQQMRAQRLALYTLPDYLPRVGKHNRYGFDAHEQLTQTFTGMGQDINVHDQWAVEGQGVIQDRTKEHLGTTDKGIIAYRRLLSSAIDHVAAGQTPLMVLDAARAQQITGPLTVDGIAPTEHWRDYPAQVDARKRAASSWARLVGPALSQTDAVR